jgi:hypothetical protein
MPVASVVHEESASATPVKAGKAPHRLERSTRRQNSWSLERRSSTLLPAIRLALMAPIEVPISQSGSMPASCSA